jgi:tetratricopeptide (TPR) repeat protein
VASNLKLTPFLGLGAAALAAFLFVPTHACAEDDAAKEDAPSLSDATGDGLAKLDPLIKNKDWAGAMAIVDQLLNQAAADSYDQAFLNETEAQILTQKGDYPAAVAPLERALTIADRHHYFSAKQEMDMLYFLSQLYYQQADSLKNDREGQVGAYNKAIGYIERWFTLSPKPAEDISLYYAQLLYAAAVAKDPAHPDIALIHKARTQVEKTLQMSIHPKDSLYIFLLATLQQENDYVRASEVLELLLSHNPNSRAYWQDLNMFYMALAQDPKDKNEDNIKKYNIRAINTIERAQALGFMKSSRDNYTLFTLYYNIGQYGMAADLLYKGLEGGTIDPDLNNWLLLAASYQQINQDFKAIEVLEEAAKRFPKNGELEFKIAQAYQQLDNNEESYKHSQMAVDKGNVAKPTATWLFVAYEAYEVGKFDEAKVAIEKTIELAQAKADGKADHQMLGLQSAIEEAIKERDSKKAPADAAPQAIPATTPPAAAPDKA